jgi:TPR repeat protein
LRELRKLLAAAKESQFFHPVAMSKEWEKNSSFWSREEAKKSLALLQAQTFLYESYQERDPQKAAAIIVTEAERGSIEAINLLGLITYQGEGVPKDPKKALELWRGLAEQGDANAQFNLGACYYNGTGAAKDEREAVKWFTKSAEQGNANAQKNLGVCYQNGKGVGKDEKEAVKWYTKSAEQGNEDAQKALGMLKSKTP